jgi:hypothetical protein
MRVNLKPKGKRGHNKVNIQVVLMLKVISDLPRSVSNKTINRKNVGDSILVDLEYDDWEIIERCSAFSVQKIENWLANHIFHTSTNQ